jgi:hypothetical protein
VLACPRNREAEAAAGVARRSIELVDVRAVVEV